MHLPGYGSPSREEVEWANNYLKTKYADILTRLGSGQTPVTYEELRVAGLFQNQPGDYVTAASNIRVQQGLRERFRESLVRGHYYLPRMTKTFEANGLPAELAVLPLVESGFTCSARSSAGAVGIWQFTRSTGKQFLTISRRHDDRLNATRSTQAAAELLRYNYQVLGDWALAITAYNYGTYGMARAAATYGQDFGRILQSYDGRSFGFASKNYYAEFLAALQIYRAEDEYFPGISDEITAPAPAPQIIEASYEPSRNSRRSHNHRMASRHHGPVHRVALKGRRGRHPVQRTIYHAKKTKAVRKA
jgi:membrane-bound lytic murein transglycosylase D